MPLGPSLRSQSRSYGVGSLLAGTNADRFADGTHENLSVADLLGSRRVLNGFHGTLDQGIVHDDFDNHLWDEVDFIFGAPIMFGVTLLSPKAFRLHDGHALDAHFVQRRLHVVELEGLDDGFDLL